MNNRELADKLVRLGIYYVYQQPYYDPCTKISSFGEEWKVIIFGQSYLDLGTEAGAIKCRDNLRERVRNQILIILGEP
jgi:hypothetical protein